MEMEELQTSAQRQQKAITQKTLGKQTIIDDMEAASADIYRRHRQKADGGTERVFFGFLSHLRLKNRS